MPSGVTVERIWPQSVVCVIGGGPSLTQSDVAACAGQHTIVINQGYEMAPWADILFVGDTAWLERHPGALECVPSVYSLSRKIEKGFPTVNVLRNTGRDGLELQPTGLRSGKNSGHASINLAYHLGAKYILLLGFDMQMVKGRRHWHEDDHEQRPQTFREWINAMTGLSVALRERGVTVINCTPDSALACFPKQPIQEALAWITTQK